MRFKLKLLGRNARPALLAVCLAMVIHWGSDARASDSRAFSEVTRFTKDIESCRGLDTLVEPMSIRCLEEVLPRALDAYRHAVMGDKLDIDQLEVGIRESLARCNSRAARFVLSMVFVDTAEFAGEFNIALKWLQQIADESRETPEFGRLEPAWALEQRILDAMLLGGQFGALAKRVKDDPADGDQDTRCDRLLARIRNTEYLAEISAIAGDYSTWTNAAVRARELAAGDAGWCAGEGTAPDETGRSVLCAIDLLEVSMKWTDRDLRDWMRLAGRMEFHRRSYTRLRLLGEIKSALISSGRALALAEALSVRPNAFSLLVAAQYAKAEYLLGRKHQATDRIQYVLGQVQESGFAGTWLEELLLSSALEVMRETRGPATALGFAERLVDVAGQSTGRGSNILRYGLASSASLALEAGEYLRATNFAGRWKEFARRCEDCDKAAIARASEIEGRALLALDRADAAAASFIEAIDTMSKPPVGELDGHIMATYFGLLANAYAESGDDYNTERSARMCLEIASRSAPEVALKDSARCATWLISSLVKRDQKEEAVETATGWITKLGGGFHEEKGELLRARALVYEKMGKPDDARNDRQAAEELRSER